MSSHDNDTDSDVSIMSDIEAGWSMVDREGDVESSDDSAEFVQLSSSEKLVTFHHREWSTLDTADASEALHEEELPPEQINIDSSIIAEIVVENEAFSKQPASEQIQADDSAIAGVVLEGEASRKELTSEQIIVHESNSAGVERGSFSKEITPKQIHTNNFIISFGLEMKRKSISEEEEPTFELSPVEVSIGAGLVDKERKLLESATFKLPSTENIVENSASSAEAQECLTSTTFGLATLELAKPALQEVNAPVFIEEVSHEVVEMVSPEEIDKISARVVDTISHVAVDTVLPELAELVSVVLDETNKSRTKLSVELILEADVDLSDGMESIASTDWPESVGDEHSSGDDFITVKSHEDDLQQHFSKQQDDSLIQDSLMEGQLSADAAGVKLIVQNLHECDISLSLPVTEGDIAMFPPVTKGDISTSFPVSEGAITMFLPATEGDIFMSLPVPEGDISISLPVTEGDILMSLPLTEGDIAMLLPFTEGDITGLPVTEGESVAEGDICMSALATESNPSASPGISEDIVSTSSSTENSAGLWSFWKVLWFSEDANSEDPGLVEDTGLVEDIGLVEDTELVEDDIDECSSLPITVVLVACVIFIIGWAVLMGTHDTPRNEPTGEFGSHSETYRHSILVNTSDIPANVTEDHAVRQHQMVLAVTRAWQRKYEQLVHERADLEMRLKAMQDSSSSEKCSVSYHESEVTWQLSKQLTDLESKYAAEAAANLSAFERHDNETKARIHELVVRVAELKGELKLIKEMNSNHDSVGQIIREGYSSDRLKFVETENDKNVAQNLRNDYHICQAELRDIRDERNILTEKHEVNRNELLSKDANLTYLQNQLALMIIANSKLKKSQSLCRETKLIENERVQNSLNVNELRNELNELRTENADLRAQLLSQRYNEHPGNGMNGPSPTEVDLRRNMSLLAVQNDLLRRRVNELLNNSTHRPGNEVDSDAAEKDERSQPLASDFIATLLNVKMNWIQLCSELTTRLNVGKNDSELLVEEILNICNRSAKNATSGDATLRGYVNKTITKLGQTIQSTIKSVRNITDEVFNGKQKFIRNMSEKVKDSIKKMNSKVQSKLKRLNEKFEDWRGRFFNWGKDYGKSWYTAEEMHGDKLHDSKGMGKSQDKNSKKKNEDSKEKRWRPEKPNQYLHEEFFEDESSDWYAHESSLMSTIEDILGTNEWTFHSMFGETKSQDVYNAFEQYRVYFKDAPKRLYIWINCQRTWWRIQGRYREHSDEDILKGCRKQLLHWQLKFDDVAVSDLSRSPVVTELDKQAAETELDDDPSVEMDMMLWIKPVQRKREVFRASRSQLNVVDLSSDEEIPTDKEIFMRRKTSTDEKIPGDDDILQDISLPTFISDQTFKDVSDNNQRDPTPDDQEVNDEEGYSVSESGLPHEGDPLTVDDDSKWYFDRMIVREDWRHDPSWYLRGMSRNDWRIDASWYLKAMKRSDHTYDQCKGSNGYPKRVKAQSNDYSRKPKNPKRKRQPRMSARGRR